MRKNVKSGNREIDNFKELPLNFQHANTFQCDFKRQKPVWRNPTLKEN